MIYQNNRHTRRSQDSCWPLRGADGLTWAERKAAQEATETDAWSSVADVLASVEKRRVAV